MDEQQKTPTIDESKASLKNTLFDTLNKSLTELIKTTLTPKFLGKVIIAWCLLSVLASGVRRFMVDEKGVTLCARTVPLDSYVAGKLLCPQ